MKNKLKPCPFCNGQPVITNADDHSMLPWHLECCLIDTWYDTKAGAIKEWESRENPPYVIDSELLDYYKHNYINALISNCLGTNGAVLAVDNEFETRIELYYLDAQASLDDKPESHARQMTVSFWAEVAQKCLSSEAISGILGDKQGEGE